MTNLQVCPSTLEPGHDTYSGKALRLLFDRSRISHILPYDRVDSDATIGVIQRGNGRISLSGVQEKISCVCRQGQIWMSEDGEQGRYILKPIPASRHLQSRDNIPANEHVSMQIATQVYKIDTAANGLCFWQDGNPSYITRRFDVRPDGGKYAMEDFASLAGLTRRNGGSDYKYSNLSYEECGELIERHASAAIVDKLKFFRIVIYNFLISNDDAHLKNFSLIQSEYGGYRLAPAYDLINTFIHLRQPRIFALDKGLFREGMPLSDIQGVSGADFIQFGLRLGIREKMVRDELERFCAEYDTVNELVSHSFLSEFLKDLYLQCFKYRRQMLRKK